MIIVIIIVCIVECVVIMFLLFVIFRKYFIEFVFDRFYAFD